MEPGDDEKTPEQQEVDSRVKDLEEEAQTTNQDLLEAKADQAQTNLDVANEKLENADNEDE